MTTRSLNKIVPIPEEFVPDPDLDALYRQAVAVAEPSGVRRAVQTGDGVEGGTRRNVIEWTRIKSVAEN